MQIKTTTGKNIAIKQGEKAIIELNNSLFNDGGQFKGSYSYPVKLALTPETMEAIDYATNLEKKVKHPLINVVVYLNNQVFRNSVLSLAIDGSEVEGTLQIDLRLINDLIKETNLDRITDEQHYMGANEADLTAHMKLTANNTEWRVYPYTFFPVKNPLFAGEVTQVPSSVARVSNKVINEISLGSGTFQFLASSGTGSDNVDGDRDLKHKVPFFYLPYVLKKVAEFLGYEATGDFLNHPDVEQIVINNINELTYANGFYAGFWEHVPTMTVEDFFKAIIGFFNIRITLDVKGSKIVFAWKKSAIENPKVLDFRSLKYKILQQNINEPQGFTLKAEVDKLADDGSEIKDEVVFGDGKNTNPLKAGTLRMSKQFIGTSTTQNYELPIQEKDGNLWDERSYPRRANSVSINGIKEFPLRFVFNKGAGQQVYGNYYPKGDINGTEFSLKLSGANSLYTFAHLKWLEAVNSSKTTRIQILLSGAVINQLKDDDVILIEAENGASVYCLWEKVKFTEQIYDSQVLAEIDLKILNSVINTDQVDEFEIFVRFKISGRQLIDTRTVAFVDFEVWENKFCTIPANAPNIKLVTKAISTQLKYENYGTSTETVAVEIHNTYGKGIFNLPSIRYTDFSSPLYGGKITLNALSTNSPTNRFDTTYAWEILPGPGYTVLNTLEIP